MKRMTTGNINGDCHMLTIGKLARALADHEGFNPGMTGECRVYIDGPDGTLYELNDPVSGAIVTLGDLRLIAAEGAASDVEPQMMG